MNGVMAGMVAVMVPAMARVPGVDTPDSPRFWFVMSMALLAGCTVTYPINWWLVGQGLKHGMMTVRPEGDAPPTAGGLWAAGYALRVECEHDSDAAAVEHRHGPHGYRGAPLGCA